MTQLELANIALGHLGTLSLVTYGESSPEGIQVSRQWNLVRDALLRRRVWNFAVKRVALTLNGLVSLAGCAVTTGSTTVNCTSTAGVTAGMNLTGTGVPWGTTVASVTDATHLVMSAAANTTTTGQTFKASTPPAFGWHFAYVLPTDYILAQSFNDQNAGTGQACYEIEGSLLLCNQTETANLRYVCQVTDTTVWDESFCEAFTLKLASRIAGGLTSAPGLAGQLDQRAEQYLMAAFGPNNQETHPRAITAQSDSGWLNARLGHC